MSQSNFVVARADGEGLSFQGPLGKRMSLAAAQTEITRLQSAYPQQMFALMKIVATSSVSQNVTLTPCPETAS